MIKNKMKSFSRAIVLFFRKKTVAKTTHMLGSILKYSFFVLVLLILYLPIVIIAIQSVNDSRQFYGFTGFTLQWWQNVLTLNMSEELMTAIATTLVVAFVATLIATVLGTIIAIGIHSLPKKKRQTMILFNQVPILNADIITGLSLMFIFKLIMNLIPGIFGLGSMIIAHVFFCMPYVILSVLPKLSELDENLYDAALDLGCKPAAGIAKVIIPAISAGIFTGMLIAFTMSIDDFLISFFNTGDNGGAFALGTNNISTYIYGSVNRIMAPEVYAYNTLLSLGVFIALAVVYIRSSIKKNQNHTNGVKASKI
jgi:spermidine/putrescine transport system permease protein